LEYESKSHPLDDLTEPRSRRHVASFAASIAAHAIVVAMIVYFASPMARRHNEWVLAYLVEGADGASGPRSGASAAAPGSAMRAPSTAPASAHPAPPPTAARKPRRRPAAADVASVAPARAPADTRPHEPAADAAAPHRGADAPSLAAVSGNGGSGTSTAAGAGTGAGTASGAAAGGSGGGSDSIAHADYASDPPPTYPALARRREQQGTVTVRVLVGADGTVERAELAESSGFDALDDAALQTVRSRWRFVPARHDGVAVESWVLVPIRFALVEANAAR